jgi:hypothetical protein
LGEGGYASNWPCLWFKIIWSRPWQWLYNIHQMNDYTKLKLYIWIYVSLLDNHILNLIPCQKYFHVYVFVIAFLKIILIILCCFEHVFTCVSWMSHNDPIFVFYMVLPYFVFFTIDWLIYIYIYIFFKYVGDIYTPAPQRVRGYTVLPLSVLPSVQDIFRRIFSATIDGRYLIFGHKLHIGMPYCG